MLQTHGKFMKYVLFTLHRMTPEQMKMNPIKPIIKVKTNEELDTEEEESYRTGLHQTCLSLPSDVAVSPFQNSNGSTWTCALCQG